MPSALLLGWGLNGALVLGGITYISSSGIIAKLLDDLGRLGNRETPVVLSILVIEDLVMAFYLPLTAGLLIGGDAWQTALEVVRAVCAVIVTLIVAVRFGPGVSTVMFTRSKDTLLLTLLGVAVLVAGMAEHLQASAAVGAFLVGIAISGPAKHSARELLVPLRDLFAAMFFAFFGLQIDPAELPGVLAIAAALAVLTAATKLATGWWSAARVGIERPGRLRAGTVLTVRGEFSIVIAGIAVAEGVNAEIGPRRRGLRAHLGDRRTTARPGSKSRRASPQNEVTSPVGLGASVRPVACSGRWLRSQRALSCPRRTL